MEMPNDDPWAVTREKVRVLLAEDQVLVRTDIADTLRGEGWEVIEVGTADDALAVLARDSDFQVLLTDVHMPGSCGGLELARFVKQNHEHVLVAVMSGQHAVDGDERVYLDVFLPKPVHDLVRKLASLMKGINDQSRNV